VPGSIITFTIDLESKKFFIKCNTKKIDMFSKVNKITNLKPYDNHMKLNSFYPLIDDF